MKTTIKEDHLQEVCTRYMALQYPMVLYYHVPNGGKRDAVTAARLKRQGVKPGIPDCVIDEPRAHYHGLRIELKVKGGSVRDSQKDVIEMLNARGYKAVVAWSFDEFKKIVDEYLK